jgi:hypothetical protein
MTWCFGTVETSPFTVLPVLYVSFERIVLLDFIHRLVSQKIEEFLIAVKCAVVGSFVATGV